MSVGQPSVTALLPAYNAAAFIDETLQSLAAQTYPNLRVLISVDASTDDTAERCERVARGDARFTVVRQPQRLGWIDNSRELLRRAESDLCFFMGHDDVVEPEYVEALVAALVANPRAVMAHSDMELFRPDGRRTTRAYVDLDGVNERRERARMVLLRGHAWANTYRGLFRTSVAHSGQPLRKHLAGDRTADWPFLLHFALAGECVRVPSVLYRKRMHAGSLTASRRIGVHHRVSVDLCCGRMLLQADLPLRERTRLLATLARRMAMDVIELAPLLGTRARRRIRRGG